MNPPNLHPVCGLAPQPAPSCSRARGRLALCLLMAGLGLPSGVLAQSDDFNDGNDSGWYHYHPLGETTASFSFPGGGYRIEALLPPTPYYGSARVATLRTNVSYTDFYVAVDLVDWNGSTDQAVGILARVQPDLGIQITDGYSFTIQVADYLVSISRITDESPDDLSGTSVPFALDPTKDYRLVFIGQGSRLEGRIYTHPDLVTPVLTVVGIDGTYTAGHSGLIVADLSGTTYGVGDATFDNYVALDVEPPRLTIQREGPSQLAVAWPQPSTGFYLEHAPALPSAAWTLVLPEDISPEGTNWVYRPAMTPTHCFFRLNRPNP
ncbi:MAG: hypothetical protein JXQ71_00390 [Verrucomicrobia bacterium]|nr:hypothetical protein [Verrucomicrobiota bacterium]